MKRQAIVVGIVVWAMVIFILNMQGFAQQPSKDVINLKLVHQWPQDGKDYVVGTGIKFANEVEKRTKGQIKITFYPASSMVKASETHTALKKGVADLSIYPYIYSSGAIPEMELIQMPGIWKNANDIYAWRNSEAYKYLEKKANEYGFKKICWIQVIAGFASKKKAIHRPEDVKGLKVRAVARYLEYGMKEVGAGIVSMTSAETYTAMQRGVVNAVLTSCSSLIAYRIYEISDYCVTGYPYTLAGTVEPICISMKTWEKLNPEQQRILVQVGEELEEDAFRACIKSAYDLEEVFVKHGVKVEPFTKDDSDAWQKIWEKYAFPKFEQEVPNGKWLLEKSLKTSN